MGFLQKYSPRTFNELVGKKARGIILNQLAGRLSSQIEVLNGNIKEKQCDPLRLLLVGPQGSGKTTGARLAAKSHFCSAGRDGGPCGVCATCLKFEEVFDFNYGSFNIPEFPSCTPTTNSPGSYYFKVYDFANINAEEIRSLLDEIGVPKGPRFFSSHPEVVVIDEAHRADKPQQNMLLTALDGTTMFSSVICCVAKDSLHKLDPGFWRRFLQVDFEPEIGEVLTFAKDVALKESIQVATESAIVELVAGVKLIPGFVLNALEMAKSEKETITSDWVKRTLKKFKPFLDNTESDK